jgi:glycine/D-amino acid oxidase-like deaminating enzyme
MVPEMADIVVIGAGVVGAHVAYRLAQRGARVTVLDAGAPGAGTSSASFAWLNAFPKTPQDYHALNAAGMAEYRGLTGELGRASWLHQDGGLHWRDTAEAQAALRETVDRVKGWGYPVEVVSTAAARELEPDLVIGPGVDEVVVTPSEGYVDAIPLIGALLTAARRHGAAVHAGQRVVSVLRAGHRVQGVTTHDGARFAADVVVDCAGPAADEVARLAGIALPLNRVPGRLVYSRPVGTTLLRPIHAPGVHFRPDGGGRVVLADETHDVTFDPRATWTAQESLARAAAYLPPLAGGRVEGVRVGVRPMPRDQKPMVGPIPGLEGFYVVVSHSGVTLGPLWGRIAAAELLDRTPDPRLAPYRPARFLS